MAKRYLLWCSSWSAYDYGNQQLWLLCSGICQRNGEPATVHTICTNSIWSYQCLSVPGQQHTGYLYCYCSRCHQLQLDLATERKHRIGCRYWNIGSYFQRRVWYTGQQTNPCYCFFHLRNQQSDTLLSVGTVPEHTSTNRSIYIGCMLCDRNQQYHYVYHSESSRCFVLYLDEPGRNNGGKSSEWIGCQRYYDHG